MEYLDQVLIQVLLRLRWVGQQEVNRVIQRCQSSGSLGVRVPIWRMLIELGVLQWSHLQFLERVFLQKAQELHYLQPDHVLWCLEAQRKMMEGGGYRVVWEIALEQSWLSNSQLALIFQNMTFAVKNSVSESVSSSDLSLSGVSQNRSSRVFRQDSSLEETKHLSRLEERSTQGNLAALEGSGGEWQVEGFLPGYRILRKLGEGGMGVVYQGMQTSLDRLVAIKVLAQHLLQHREFIERLEREAKILAKLNHPNIVSAIDSIRRDNFYCLVMEYIDGHAIDVDLKGGKVFSEREALHIVLQVAQALEHAHAHNLVHRDIKPANIMLDKGGTVKLCDLGLAVEVERSHHLTQSSVSLGTPAYMSPEQARGEKDIDIRSDFYSLGGTLYHMVTGKPPYEAPGVGGIYAQILSPEVPDPRRDNPGISSGIRRLIQRMMAQDREDRPSSPQELIDLIKSLQRGLGKSSTVILRPSSGSRKISQSQIRKKVPVSKVRNKVSPAVLAAWITGAMVGVVFLLFFLFRSPGNPSGTKLAKGGQKDSSLRGDRGFGESSSQISRRDLPQHPKARSFRTSSQRETSQGEGRQILRPGSEGQKSSSKSGSSSRKGTSSSGSISSTSAENLKNSDKNGKSFSRKFKNMRVIVNRKFVPFSQYTMEEWGRVMYTSAFRRTSRKSKAVHHLLYSFFSTHTSVLERDWGRRIDSWKKRGELQEGELLSFLPRVKSIYKVQIFPKKIGSFALTLCFRDRSKVQVFWDEKKKRLILLDAVKKSTGFRLSQSLSLQNFLSVEAYKALCRVGVGKKFLLETPITSPLQYFYITSLERMSLAAVGVVVVNSPLSVRENMDRIASTELLDAEKLTPLNLKVKTIAVREKPLNITVTLTDNRTGKVRYYKNWQTFDFSFQFKAEKCKSAIVLIPFVGKTLIFILKKGEKGTFLARLKPVTRFALFQGKTNGWNQLRIRVIYKYFMEVYLNSRKVCILDSRYPFPKLSVPSVSSVHVGTPDGVVLVRDFRIRFVLESSSY
ncbi:MAG: serine/threonine protein kinase [Planctomycetota bacterium]|nr:MAG: serine/threonine protein kinase [Planctomycetota bacterium]